MTDRILVRAAPDRVAFTKAKGGERIEGDTPVSIKLTRWIQRRIDDGDLIVVKPVKSADRPTQHPDAEKAKEVK